MIFHLSFLRLFHVHEFMCHLLWRTFLVGLFGMREAKSHESLLRSCFAWHISTPVDYLVCCIWVPMFCPKHSAYILSGLDYESDRSSWKTIDYIQISGLRVALQLIVVGADSNLGYYWNQTFRIHHLASEVAECPSD